MKRSEIRRNVQQVVNQIVAVAHPVRIILFGSAVNGKFGPDSDLDFLIVVPDNLRPDAVADSLNTGVRPRTVPCDFVVVTRSVLERQGQNPGLIYAEILERGKEVYVARKG